MRLACTLTPRLFSRAAERLLHSNAFDRCLLLRKSRIKYSQQHQCLNACATVSQSYIAVMQSGSNSRSKKKNPHLLLSLLSYDLTIKTDLLDPRLYNRSPLVGFIVPKRRPPLILSGFDIFGSVVPNNNFPHPLTTPSPSQIIATSGSDAKNFVRPL